MSEPGLVRSLALAAVAAAAVFVASTLLNGDSISVLWLAITIVVALGWVAAAYRRRNRAAR